MNDMFLKTLLFRHPFVIIFLLLRNSLTFLFGTENVNYISFRGRKKGPRKKGLRKKGLPEKRAPEKRAPEKRA